MGFIMEKFVIVDIETTGLSPKRHKIIEIAALKFHKDQLVDEFVSLVNPKAPISRFITRFTGIDNTMVNDSPTIDLVLDKFMHFLSDHPFVAHNATFDYSFLDNALLKHHGRHLTNPKICTCRLARRLLPFLPSKGLASLCEHLEITNTSAHRAKGDALATAEILYHFKDLMQKRNISALEEIELFQRSRIVHTV